jgi:hypothetical protein
MKHRPVTLKFTNPVKHRNPITPHAIARNAGAHVTSSGSRRFDEHMELQDELDALHEAGNEQGADNPTSTPASSSTSSRRRIR